MMEPGQRGMNVSIASGKTYLCKTSRQPFLSFCLLKTQNRTAMEDEAGGWWIDKNFIRAYAVVLACNFVTAYISGHTPGSAVHSMQHAIMLLLCMLLYVTLLQKWSVLVVGLSSAAFILYVFEWTIHGMFTDPTTLLLSCFIWSVGAERQSVVFWVIVSCLMLKVTYIYRDVSEHIVYQRSFA